MNVNRRIPLALAGAAVAIVAALWFLRSGTDEPRGAASQIVDGVVQDSSGRRVLYWYDPMAPEHRFERPGKSPFMDMQLVPKYADEAGPDGVRISSAVEQNLAIRLAQAEATPLGEDITAAGRIEVDERRTFELQPRVAGFIERLLVRAEGEPVTAGQKIAEIYSPELLAAQQELVALSSLSDVPDRHSLVRAVRERLRLLGMAEAEIEAVTRSGRAQTRFGLYSPTAGFVAELPVRQGVQISPGTALMRIADLSSVWLVAAVPEPQAGLIRPGDRVTAKLEGLPAGTAEGEVDYIYPTLDISTRTARVRMSLPNDRGTLRPGMFATATIATPRRQALTVPSEAVIFTGERAVVILRDAGQYRPVQIRTGAELGGRTEILEGLGKGDTVVASGQFFIDSEASLSGVLARMSSQGAAPQPHEDHAAPPAHPEGHAP